MDEYIHVFYNRQRRHSHNSGTNRYALTPYGCIRWKTSGTSTTPSLTLGTRETLFRAPLDPTFTMIGVPYDVSADGQRFLMVVPAAEIRRPVNVILNWQELLKK